MSVTCSGSESLMLYDPGGTILSFSAGVPGLLTASNQVLPTRSSQIADAGLHSKTPLLAELHEALQYDLLAHAPPAETFPVNYA